MVNKKFLFSFLLLTFIIFSFVLVSSAPSKVASPSSRTIAPFSSYTFNYKDFFRDFSSWSMNYTVDGVPFASSVQESSLCSRIDGVIRACVGNYTPSLTIQNLGNVRRNVNLTLNVSDGSSSVGNFISVVFGQTGAPYQVASIPLPNLGTNGSITYNLDDYFNNFDTLCWSATLMNVSNPSQNISSTTSITGVPATNCIDGGGASVNYTLLRGQVEHLRNPTTGVWSFIVKAYGNESLIKIDWELRNVFGSAYYSFYSYHSSTSAVLTANQNSTFGAPYPIISLAPKTLGSGQSYTFKASDYFGGNVTDFTVSWEDTINLQSAYVNALYGGSPSTYSGLIQVNVLPIGNDFNITVTGLGNTATFPIQLIAKNSVGESTLTYILTSVFSSTSGSGTTTSSDLRNGSSIIGYLTSIFDDVFPAKETLSVKYRFAFVFITLLIVNLLAFLLMMQSGSIKFLGWIILVLDVLLIFYFLAIQYIPISILIFFILLLLAGSYFKLRGGS